MFKYDLNPQFPQATVCCYVGATALVHLRPGGPGLPNRGFKTKALHIQSSIRPGFEPMTSRLLQNIPCPLLRRPS